MYTDTQIYTHTYKQARIILHDIIEGVEKGKHTISFARFHCCSRALRARARAVPFNSEKGNRSYAKTAPFLCTCRDSCMCVCVCMSPRERERERERVCVRACKVVYVCEDVLFTEISNTCNMLRHNLQMFVDARTFALSRLTYKDSHTLIYTGCTVYMSGKEQASAYIRIRAECVRRNALCISKQTAGGLHACTHIHTDPHANSHSHSITCTCTCTRTCTRTRTRTRTHAHTHAHTHQLDSHKNHDFRKNKSCSMHNICCRVAALTERERESERESG